ncbi:serine protease [Ruegeria sp. HKCCC2117]|uniref:S1 family peptidase n=1 Tax=Ruegeria sp. HKCCC2117 TaxID=2682992 RepID=UPI0014896456|nr:serine protease [Ruegeria sp. HKCCC2117]
MVDFNEWYAWGENYDEARNGFVAKVYDRGEFSHDDYRGNAFVIDDQNGLLLSPLHVIESAFDPDAGSDILAKRVSLRFHSDGGIETANASVVRIHRGDTKTDGPNDLALIRLEEPPSDWPALQRMRLINTHDRAGRVRLVSFVRNGASATPIAGTSEKLLSQDGTSELVCKARLRNLTAGGDSGGAVLDENDHVIGIVLRKVNEQGTDEGSYLTMRCAWPQLVDWYREALPSEVDNVKNKILSYPPDKLQKILGRRDGTFDINNVMFHAALIEIEEQLGNLAAEEIIDLQEKFACPLNHALFGRHSTMASAAEFLRKLYRSVPDGRTTFNAIKGMADQNLIIASTKNVDTWQVEDASLQAMVLYAIATETADSSIGALFSRDFQTTPEPPVLTSPDGTLPIPPVEISEAAVAEAYLGLADILLFRSRFMDTTSEEKNNRIALARMSALAAARLAVDEAPYIADQALSLYGDAAEIAGDYDAASASFALSEELRPRPASAPSNRGVPGFLSWFFVQSVTEEDPPIVKDATTEFSDAINEFTEDQAKKIGVVYDLRSAWEAETRGFQEALDAAPKPGDDDTSLFHDTIFHERVEGGISNQFSYALPSSGTYQVSLGPFFTKFGALTNVREDFEVEISVLEREGGERIIHSVSYGTQRITPPRFYVGEGGWIFVSIRGEPGSAAPLTHYSIRIRQLN